MSLDKLFEQVEADREYDIGVEEADRLRRIEHDLHASLWELEEALRDIRVSRAHHHPLTRQTIDRLHLANTMVDGLLSHLKQGGFQP